MTTLADPKSCPDCQASLQPIVLLASRETPFGHEASPYKVAHYAEVPAEPSFWSGLFKPKGLVRSWKCSSCHRVFLCGQQE